MLSINTNVSSLQAQNYLRQTEAFQNQTIQQVTSGLRVVNSGVDAAGLAIANADRSNEAVLTQGIQNASDAQSQLQIADGGLSNISQLLDRARTLATESASGSFSGDRNVLNSEFQSVIQEVNRQAQAIGLNQGGSLATNLGVFVGGGLASGGATAIGNGTLNVNLSSATVDAKSLGLQGVRASGTAGTDIGDASTTSVQTILNNSSNQASISNNTMNFYFYGPGFSNTSGSGVVKVSVNLTSVTDANTLVTAINNAIAAAGGGNSQQATAFKNANITAAINTDSTGKEQLTFNSATTAFQVQGGDQVANALMGNFSSGAQGASAAVTATAAGNFAAPTAAESNVQIRILGAGLNGSSGNDLSVSLATTDTVTSAVAKINTAIAANPSVAATGLQAVVSGSRIQFVGGQPGQSFSVMTAGDTYGALGFGSFQSGSGNVFNYTGITAGAASAAHNTDFQFSVNGGPTVDLGVITGSATEATALANLNAAFQGNATARAAGLVALDNGGNIEILSQAGVYFRLNTYGGTGDGFGFGDTGVTSANATAVSGTANDTVNSAGAQASVNAANSDPYLFTALTNATDAQTITLSAVDAQGTQHSLNIALTSSNAGNLDQALNTINAALQSSNDSTLKQIAAFKQMGAVNGDAVNGKQGILFMDAGGSFKVSLGASPASLAGPNAGLSDGATGVNGGAVLSSASNGAGSTADISNVSTATAAVSQLATSVQLLGDAQAAVGRGENLMSYASNLANSQLTNTQAAESGIRDVDMATASANLTKSQIELQAGIAALAQANSAPQQVLTLLQH